MLSDISNQVQYNGRSSSFNTKKGEKTPNLSNSSNFNMAQRTRHTRTRSSANRRNNGSGNYANLAKQNLIKLKPNYKFPNIYKKISDHLFPYMQLDHLIQSTPQDEIDLTSGANFPSNLIKKYSQPVQDSFTKDIEFLKPSPKNRDPMDQLFNSKKNRASNNNNEIQFGESVITINDKGAIDSIVKRPQPPPTTNPLATATIVPDTPIGSKRTIHQVIDSTPICSNANEFPANISLLTCSSKSSLKSQSSLLLSPSTSNNTVQGHPVLINHLSPLQPSSKSILNKRLKTLKVKHRNERLDNSMTISAKAIMKMVDDSLVSSDTEFYTHTMSQIHPSRANINANSNVISNGEKISINADDLKNALTDSAFGDDDDDNEDDEDRENKIVLDPLGRQRAIRNTRSTIWGDASSRSSGLGPRFR